MVLYECKHCSLKTHLKGNYDQHLNTKKHKRNVEKNNASENSTKIAENSTKIAENSTKIAENSTKKAENSTKKAENSTKKAENSTVYKCKHCNLILKTRANLLRHMNHYCNVLKYNDENYKLKDKIAKMEKQHQYEKKKYEIEKTELYKKIDELISKVGNTYNQNIILNNFGSEDLSHITDTFKTQLLKIPFGMIPKLIEAVHFSDDKPENKNIALTNKKDNILMVFKGNKWIHQNKKEVISNLMDSKYFLLDNHYNIMMNQLNTQCQGNYIKFRQYMNKGDKELVENLQKECEIVFLNNRK